MKPLGGHITHCFNRQIIFEATEMVTGEITGLRLARRHWRTVRIARNIREIKFNGSHPIKQGITLALDREVLVAARVFAVQQGISVRAMLAEELRKK